jgi:queuine/archaeosine tRNA-ribosyltransferase
VVVCSALGADMYDSVYPTRTARFGVALVDSGGCYMSSPVRQAVDLCMTGSQLHVGVCVPA